MIIEDFSLNTELFRIVNSARSPLLDTFFYYFSFLGSGWVILPLLLFLYFRARDRIKPLLSALALETAIVLLLKTFLNQPRPASLLEDVNLMFPLYWRSFPSGDTAMAFTIASVLSHRSPLWLRILLYAYAALIGYGRIYAGVHFPLDVLAGALIGIGSGKLTLYLYNRIRGGSDERG